MASNDTALAGAGIYNLRRVEINKRWYHVDALHHEAISIEAKARCAKVAGDLPRALELYRALLPFLHELDDVPLLGMPTWLQIQVVYRVIEQLREALDA